jgi:hypothetical protein
MSKKYPYDIYPIFETEEFTPDPLLISIIMPFTEEHDKNFNEFIKPAVESKRFNHKKLNFKRADDISKPGKHIFTKVLNLNKDFFYDNLFTWAKKYNFRIDGDFIVTENADIDGFICDLDKQSEIWKQGFN